jgi:hypothetical protein
MPGLYLYWPHKHVQRDDQARDNVIAAVGQRLSLRHNLQIQRRKRKIYHWTRPLFARSVLYVQPIPHFSFIDNNMHAYALKTAKFLVMTHHSFSTQLFKLHYHFVRFKT